MIIRVLQSDDEGGTRAIVAQQLHNEGNIMRLSFRIGQGEGPRRRMHITLYALDNIAFAIEIAQLDVVLFRVLELLVEIIGLLEAHLRGNCISFDMGLKVDVFRTIKIGFPGRLALRLIPGDYR